MNVQQELENRKVDHLILLVGGNPLPNAVAGRLLVNDGGRITLVHSAETFKLSDNLQQWFCRYNIESASQEVPATQAKAIYQAISNIIDEHSGTIGLNYSGGTKSMAVHAQRAVRDRLGDHADACLSYLDPRTSRMRFDDGGSIQVGLLLQVNLETDLMQLHKGLLFDQHNPPERNPVLPRTATALAEMWSDKSARDRWQNWMHGDLKRYQLRRSTFGQHRWQNWASNSRLRQAEIAFPPVVQDVLRAELEENGYPSSLNMLNLGAAYECFLYAHHQQPFVEDFCEWLWGKWLEHYVFHCLDQLRPRYCFHSILLGVETRPTRFEVDVVAIRGYQLFAFSCSTTFKHDKLKLKLFEAVVRARQLGGGEARIALVCTNNQPTRLQEEFKNTIDRRIRVFGLYELATLQTEIADWIMGR